MRYQINLLPPKEANITDKVIYFSFHYLRYILIITQLVVIVVFFTRFKVDQEMVDLKDSIKQKSEIVAVSDGLLKDLKNIDLKMRSVGTLLADQNRLQQMYSYFLSTFPSELFLTKLEMTDKSVTLEGYTDNIDIVRIYNNRLSKDKRFKEVQLVSLKRSEINYTFNIALVEFIPTATP